MISCCPLLAAQPGDPTHWASCPHILSMTHRHPLPLAWPPMPKLGRPRESSLAQMERPRPEKVSDMPKVTQQGRYPSAALTVEL